MARRKRSRKNRAKSSKQPRRNAQAANKDSLATLLNWFLPDARIFANVKFHGNTQWLPVHLVWLALFWAWSESRNLTDAFTEARECCRKTIDSSPLGTYQGFMGAMTRWTGTFVPLLCLVLQQRMQEIGGRFWSVDGWVPIAFDGSRSTAPRSRGNERAFCAPNYGKSKTAKYRKKKSKGMRRRQNQKHKPQPQEPQVWITMMWHMALRSPWSWRLGPSYSSERTHVMEMLAAGKFPWNTLFCGDAGFVGYSLWSAIRERGHDFMVRVGANVHLLTASAHCLRQKNGLVLCWPKTMMQSKQPPLRLRLVKVRIGKTSVWLLTSVLDPSELTIKMMIRLYKMRWGIEIEFRGLKQTLDRASLRSKNPKRVLAELDWSILAMAIVELFALKEQLSKTRMRTRDVADPTRRSLAKAMRAIRYCMRNLHEVPKAGQDLSALLRASITDGYDRKASKHARYRPPNPDKKPLGNPKINRLSPEQRRKLQDARANLAA